MGRALGLLAIAVVALLTTGCGLLGGSPAEFEAYDEATTRLNAALNEYDQLSAAGMQADLSQGPEIVADSIDAVDELEGAYAQWDSALTAALAADAVPDDQAARLLEYRQVLEPWVEAQSEQIDVMLPCYSDDLTSFDPQCAMERIAANAERWQRLSNELTEFEQRARAP